MIRFGVPPIGGKGWFGGWMYMRNLVLALADSAADEIETVVFVGPDRCDDPFIKEFATAAATRVVVDDSFKEDRVRSGALRTLVTGLNGPLVRAFEKEAIDVAFLPAIFLGWRSPIRSIAWFPDFQHRKLPDMFSKATWWKRELGWRVQSASSDAIMLSSRDAQASCEAYYPETKGKTAVARFAIPMDDWPTVAEARAHLEQLGLPGDYVFLPNQLWKHKNHHVAIEAARVLAIRGINRRILATGHGVDPRNPDYFAELQSAAKSVPSTAFEFLGSVDHKTVQSLMICANALLNPSLFEGWSTTVEEAKGSGTPLILSDIPVHREQCPGARFFAPADSNALAEAIEASPPRSDTEITQAFATGRLSASMRRKEFGQAVAELVKSVAREPAHPHGFKQGAGQSPL